MIFVPGPNKTFTFWALASFPRYLPNVSANSVSQLLATVVAVGKHVAGRLSLRPAWSGDSFCFLNPWGPSERKILGIPSLSKLSVVQKSTWHKVGFFF